MLLDDPSLTTDRIIDELLNIKDDDIEPDKKERATLPSFELLKVVLDGFGPHDGPNELELSKGLTLVDGRNGVGKTHLLLAVNWCIFGDRGSLDPWMAHMDPFGSDLVNWERDLEKGESMRVLVVFRWGKDRYKVERYLDENGMRGSVWKNTDGKWVERKGIPEGLDPDILPFLLFQGEAVMSLSSEGYFKGRGRLDTAVMAISGAIWSQRALERLVQAKEIMMERMESKLGSGLPIESEMDRLKGKLEVLQKEEKDTLVEIGALEKRRKSSVEDYRSSLKRLSLAGTVTKEQEEMIRARTQLPSFREEVAALLREAAREVLRTRAEEALDNALEEREERTRKRVLYGVYEAQIAIVEKVLRTKKCICGSTIGRSGMGRDRLRSLMESFYAKRAEVSDWGAEIPWTSDRVLESTRRELAKRTVTGKDLKRALRRVARTRKIIDREGTRSDTSTDPLLECIRGFERTSIQLERKKKDLSRLRSAIKKVSREHSVKRSELVRIWGKGKNSRTYTSGLERIDLLTAALEKDMKDRVEDLMERLENEVNGILAESGRKTWISGLKLHRESYTIGIDRKGAGSGRTVPLPFLSAGEREAVATLVVLSLSRITGSSLVLDSPFPYMDRGFRNEIFKMLPLHPNRVLITIPTGTMEHGELASMIENWKKKGRDVSYYRLKSGKRGSSLTKQEVGD
ncbi:MAG: ATP-binding protein [Thermoplasmatota archaeon]